MEMVHVGYSMSPQCQQWHGLFTSILRYLFADHKPLQMWLTFAPIPNYTAALYDITASQVDWFSISFFVVTLLVGFVAIAILDIFGLRVSVSAV